MTNGFDGNAIVYCEGAFNTTNGKTAHGLVRFTRRYRVLSVVDSRYAGQDAGEVIDGRAAGIPVVSSVDEAIAAAVDAGTPASRLVVGLAPDGGRLTPAAREDVLHAVRAGLGVDCGLHDFLSDDPEIAAAAETAGVHLRDIRKIPREGLHFFTGKIEEVTATRVAVTSSIFPVKKCSPSRGILRMSRRWTPAVSAAAAISGSSERKSWSPQSTPRPARTAWSTSSRAAGVSRPPSGASPTTSRLAGVPASTAAAIASSTDETTGMPAALPSITSPASCPAYRESTTESTRYRLVNRTRPWAVLPFVVLKAPSQ